MTDRPDLLGDDLATDASPGEDARNAMVESQLRELLPRASRGDLAAIDRVLDLLATRGRGDEEWMRWFPPPRSTFPGRSDLDPR